MLLATLVPHAALAAENNYLRTITHGFTLVDSRGRLYVPASSIPYKYLYPTDSGFEKTKMTPGLAEGYPLYTDANGKMFFVKELDSSNISDPIEVVVPNGASFKPDTVIGASNYMTDSNGEVYKFDPNAIQLPSQKRYLQPLNYTSKPNTSIVCNVRSCPFVDSSGNLVGSTHTIKGLTPNQFVDSIVKNDDFYYTNTAGELIRSATSEKVGINNLPSNRLYPATHLMISDLNGNLYYIGAGEPTRKIGGIKAAAGTYVPLIDQYHIDAWITDNQGHMYLCTSSCRQMSPTVQFKPGQAISAETGGIPISYAEANDGTIYMLTYSALASARTMLPTGYYTKDSATSTNPNSCVVQMPTTGAPTGLSLVGFAAMSVLSIGCLMMLIRHRYVI